MTKRKKNTIRKKNQSHSRRFKGVGSKPMPENYHSQPKARFAPIEGREMSSFEQLSQEAIDQLRQAKETGQPIWGASQKPNTTDAEFEVVE